MNNPAEFVFKLDLRWVQAGRSWEVDWFTGGGPEPSAESFKPAFFWVSYGEVVGHALGWVRLTEVVCVSGVNGLEFLPSRAEEVDAIAADLQKANQVSTFLLRPYLTGTRLR